MSCMYVCTDSAAPAHARTRANIVSVWAYIAHTHTTHTHAHTRTHSFKVFWFWKSYSSFFVLEVERWKEFFKVGFPRGVEVVDESSSINQKKSPQSHTRRARRSHIPAPPQLEGRKPCVTKCRRLGPGGRLRLRMSRDNGT